MYDKDEPDFKSNLTVVNAALIKMGIILARSQGVTYQDKREISYILRELEKWLFVWATEEDEQEYLI